jgi:general secretion pathway protein G
VNARLGRQRGATLLELGLVLVLVTIFVTIATLRIWELRLAAERTGVESTLGTLRSALSNETMVRALQGGLAQIARLDRTNPMALLERPPANYLGEFDGRDPGPPDGYQWYFDTGQGTLVYRVANREILAGVETGPELRFQVRFRFEDQDGNGRFDPATDRALGIDLERLTKFEWR